MQQMFAFSGNGFADTYGTAAFHNPILMVKIQVQIITGAITRTGPDEGTVGAFIAENEFSLRGFDCRVEARGNIGKNLDVTRITSPDGKSFIVQLNSLFDIVINKSDDSGVKAIVLIFIDFVEFDGAIVTIP